MKEDDMIQRIKDICKVKGISISKLERDCGFANSYITNLRAGKMPADRLQKVADYLGTTTKYLLTGDDEEGELYYLTPEARKIAQFIYDKTELRTLFDALRKCTPEQLKILRQMAESWDNQSE